MGARESFLGKVWAQRILQNEKSEHDRELTEFKSQIEALAQKDTFSRSQVSLGNAYM